MLKKAGNRKQYTPVSPAVDQAIEILKYLASDKRIETGITDISKIVGISKSKAHGIVDALRNAGFVSKDNKSKLYSLGPDIIPIGQRALENIDYREVTKPFLEELARETRCTVLFGIITGQNLIFIAKEASGREVDSRLSVGYSTKIFYKAHGKVILASLPEEERERLLSGDNFYDDDILGIIENTQLRKEVNDAKVKGFAMDHGSSGTIVKVLASAVLGHNNRPIGILVVIGLMKKSLIPKYGAKLAEKARSLSNALGARKRV